MAYHGEKNRITEPEKHHGSGEISFHDTGRNTIYASTRKTCNDILPRKASLGRVGSHRQHQRIRLSRQSFRLATREAVSIKYAPLQSEAYNADFSPAISVFLPEIQTPYPLMEPLRFIGFVLAKDPHIWLNESMENPETAPCATYLSCCSVTYNIAQNSQCDFSRQDSTLRQRTV